MVSKASFALKLLKTPTSTGEWIVPIVVPALIIPCLLLAAAAGFFMWRRRRRNEESRIDISEWTRLNDFHLYENGATSSSANSNGDSIGNSRMSVKMAGNCRRHGEKEDSQEDSLKNQENSPFLYEEMDASLYYNGLTRIAVTNFFETVKGRNRDDEVYNKEFEASMHKIQSYSIE
ncbi:hypothetical protein CHS0354_022149 [Potamilus streckersoni]|uniref:Uncharacterized protein n=1 Tax=Potamilus streckersoni TaxID=2493646 RepID=A0AAE0RT64_9BIVA|nr:hypothetical protein CHS0354_022149 [Potamilus streckersoni]